MFLGFSAFVKNEMQCLPELLDRIAGYFDYYVVLDTGSTDGTWEHLRAREKRGEPIHPYRVGIPFDAKHFHFGYVRSMAAHLNKAEWVMMLDADERIDDAGLKKLRGTVELANSQSKACIAFPRHNWLSSPGEHGEYNKVAYPDLQVRCILNNGVVWWRRAVHEVIKTGFANGNPPWLTSDIHIEHFHSHYRRAKNDDGSFARIYDELTKADTDWLGTY
jgi:glycosyltransferase involved in cell wall biosynthesis